MSEYIKRETAIRHLEQLKADESHNCQYERACAVNSCIERLKKQKSAEVEPVVHCKDCKYCYHSSTSYTGLRCEGWGTYNDNPCTESYWYCARGEKK